MHDMFNLSAPWWHFVLRAIAIYAMVMVLIRVSGKRAVGQFTPFDLVLLILIGNAVQNGLNGGDNSLTGALILATCLIALNYGVARATAHSRSIERLVEGEPTVLARNGRLVVSALKRSLVSEDDFRESMRLNNVARLEDVALALLETSGSISIITCDRSAQGGNGGGAMRAEDVEGANADEDDQLLNEVFASVLPTTHHLKRRRRPGSPQN